MLASRVTVAVTAVAALAGATAVAAPSTFSANICALVPTKQVVAISGVSAACTKAAPTNGPGSKIYMANWAGKTPTSARLQVTIAVYTDPGVLQLAKHNLKQGLPGTPKSVANIGSAAYLSTAADSTGLHLNVGKYIAYINVTATGKPSWSTASVEALGKAVAARL